MEYYYESGKIPQNIDLDILVQEVEGNVTFKRKIKEGVVYFLSLLSNLDEYPEYWLKNEYFIINDSRLAKIVGKGGVKSRTAIIKKLLISNKIVESIPYKLKERSSGFRLTNDYVTAELISVPFSNEIVNNLKKYESAGYKHYMSLLDGKYSHLSYNYQVNKFNILESQMRVALLDLLEVACDRVKNKRKYNLVSIRSILSYFGRSIYQLNKLVGGDYDISVSTRNNRLYSVLTQVPKLFRRFLQINKRDIGEIDINSCQLYILACIFSSDFSTSTSEGFNLKTIFPELYQKIKEFYSINPSRQANRNNELLGVYFDDRNKQIIDDFANFDFANKDFYEYMYDSALELSPKVFSGKKGYLNKVDGRKSIKSNVMNYLFDNSEINRDSNRVVFLLSLKYGAVEYFLNSFMGWYSKNDFAVLLQRCEAYLVLEKVTKALFDKKNNIPIFTIHDCIITTEDKLDYIKKNMEKNMLSITRKPVGIKTKLITNGALFDTNSINDILSKTLIDNQDQLSKANRNIRSKHIETAIDFIFKDSPDQIKKWKSVVL